MTKNQVLVLQYVTIGAIVIGGVSLASAFASRLKRKKHESDAAAANQSVAQTTDTVQEIVENFSGIEGSADRVGIWHPVAGATPHKRARRCNECQSNAQCPTGQRCKSYLSPDGTTCYKCVPLTASSAEGAEQSGMPTGKRIVTALDLRDY